MRDISDLREELFDTIKKVKSGELDKDQAKAIMSLGQVIVNSAKVEVDFLTEVGGTNGSNFIPKQTNAIGK